MNLLNASIDKSNGIFQINEMKITPRMNMEFFRGKISYEDYESHRDLFTFTLKDRLHFESTELKVLVYFNSNVLYDITILQEYSDENKNKNNYLSIEHYQILAKQLLKTSRRKF